VHDAYRAKNGSCFENYDEYGHIRHSSAGMVADFEASSGHPMAIISLQRLDSPPFVAYFHTFVT
jgi:hypothetical protein